MKNILLLTILISCFCLTTQAQSEFYKLYDTTKVLYTNKSNDPRNAIKETTDVVRASNILTPSIIEEIPINKIKSLRSLDESIKSVDVKRKITNVSSLLISILAGIYCYDKLDESSKISKSISKSESDYDALVKYNLKYKLAPPAPLDLTDLKSQKTKNTALGVAAGFVSLISVFTISETQVLKVDVPFGQVIYEITF